MNKKVIQVDFDGVIHKYSKGWQKGVIYDKPKEGAADALKVLTDQGFKVVIFCARLNNTEVADVDKEYRKMVRWLKKNGIYQGSHYDFITCAKMGVLAYIDDRCIRFTNWDDMLKYFI